MGFPWPGHKTPEVSPMQTLYDCAIWVDSGGRSMATCKPFCALRLWLALQLQADPSVSARVTQASKDLDIWFYKAK